MIFYKTAPSPENTGLKFVLWEVFNDTGGLLYDWGFSEWDGKQWGTVEVPKGFTATVVQWANTIDPKILLKEESKIIQL